MTLSNDAPVLVEQQAAITIITLNRPTLRNCVDRPTAEALAKAFRDFEQNANSTVAILTGAGGHFCAGADLKALADEPSRVNKVTADGDGPMGISRMHFSKPVIAAIEGYAVAGGLELALCADIRVVSESAIMGVFCRRWGVPLIDGGTVRLPRIIGHGRAMDLILTGRPVAAEEALQMGLANRVVADGEALTSAITLAKQIAAFPQSCVVGDRHSAYEQWDLDINAALQNELQHGLKSIQSKVASAGAARFSKGAGRHGNFDKNDGQ